MQIDIKKDRELLGLPSRSKYAMPRVLKILFGAVFVILIAGLAGRLVGRKGYQNKNLLARQLYSQIILSEEAEHVEPLARKMHALAVGGSVEEKVLFSSACLYLSEIMPRRKIWLEEGLRQIEGVQSLQISDPQYVAQVVVEKIVFLFELGREDEAFTLIKKLNNKVSEEQLLMANPADVLGGAEYYNLYAYMLTTAKDKQNRNPSLALKLIKKIIVLPDGFKSEYLDTLAAAYYAVGEKGYAVNAQRYALARSKYPGLWLLTENYKRFIQE